MKLYNTLTRDKQDFKPLNDQTVKLYACGHTVYSQPHIGNWNAYIYWDVLVRVLQANGYQVQHIQNVTDVGHLTDDGNDGEDKLAKGARREQTTAFAVAEKYAAIAESEAKQLNLLPPTSLPRASQYIEQQIAWNQQLEAAGFTYEIPDKGLYFDTAKFPDYGKLARLDIAGLRSGQRVDDSGKRNPTDFVLWRLSPPGLDPAVNWEWDSPWGKGIPGWHLECSVMASELLGNQIDIHTGGVDHINVHHTNEIAQTEAITNQQFSQFWLHGEHMLLDGKKMSKSLGNLYTLSDIVERGYDLRALKLAILSSHYRTQSNFTWSILDAAQARLNDWQAAADLRWQLADSANSDSHQLGILELLSDDLDTPGAVALIGQHFAEVRDSKAPKSLLTQLVDEVDSLLGIDLKLDDISTDQKQLLAQRAVARQAGDWQRSDELRDELARQDILVTDTADAQRWQHLLGPSK